MIKFFRKILSIDFWKSVDESSIYNMQKLATEHRQQISLLKFFNASYSKQLTKLRDNPEEPREIFHFFFFKKNKDLENFLYQIRENEFVIIGKFSVTDNENYNIGYKIMRIDKTNKPSIVGFTDMLWNLAQKHNGLYKGWETTPVKEC